MENKKNSIIGTILTISLDKTNTPENILNARIDLSRTLGWDTGWINFYIPIDEENITFDKENHLIISDYIKSLGIKGGNYVLLYNPW